MPADMQPISVVGAGDLFSMPSDVDPDMPTTVNGIDQIVAAWVATQLDMPAARFGPCAAIGIVLRGQLIAGVVYNGYRRYEEGAVIEASIAAITPKWATRQVLSAIFAYPFQQMQVTRLQVTCRKSNKRARKFVTRLGFKMDCVARRLWDGKHDAVVYSMIPEENRWTK